MMKHASQADERTVQLATQKFSKERQAPETGAEGLPLIWNLFGGEGIAPRILVLAKMIDRVTARQLHREFGLNVAQWRVLAFIGLSGPSTASKIVAGAEADPGEVSRAVRVLVAKGLVIRGRAHCSGRRKLIAQTEAGRELFERVRERRRAYFERIERPVAAADRERLNDALVLLAKAVAEERAADQSS